MILRPRWLEARVKATPNNPTPVYAHVYVDNLAYGPIESLFDISMKYESLIDKHYHRHPVGVTLAHEPDEKQIEKLNSKKEKIATEVKSLSLKIDEYEDLSEQIDKISNKIKSLDYN